MPAKTGIQRRTTRKCSIQHNPWMPPPRNLSLRLSCGWHDGLFSVMRMLYMKLKKILISLLFLCWAHLTFADTNFASRPDVQAFIDQMCHHYHFKKSELVYVFNTVRIHKQVIQQVFKPVEDNPWYTYQMIFITESRIHQGVKFWDKHRAALAAAEKKYGIPASLIVATIGVETKYGKHTGDYRVLDALSNLAFSSSRRAPFFRSELKDFLLLARENHLDPLRMKGSYAGAIGFPQFMPSSYRHYAVAYADKAHPDLSRNANDAIISIANYYKQHGWQTSQPIAVPAIVHGSNYRQMDTPITLPTKSLLHYGFTPHSHETVEKLNLIKLEDKKHDEYWIAFHNFDVIKLYNTSDLYAMAVYQLSYYIDRTRKRIL